MNFSKILSIIQLVVIVAANFEFNNKYGSPSLEGCLRRRGTQPAHVLVTVTRETNAVKYDFVNNRIVPYHSSPQSHIEVNNVANVSNSVKCARDLNIHITVRAGGHSYAKYSFGDNSTLIIDLGNLYGVTAHESSKQATVGPGVLLAQLYWGVWSQSQGRFGVPGGFCVTVGMGQPLGLGGGQGGFHKMLGIAPDNIVGFEMVEANGHLRTVNKEENENLFWALRGAGGGNFGIVNSFKYRLFDAKDLKFRSIAFIYRSELRPVLHAWDKWNEETKLRTVYSSVTVVTKVFILFVMNLDFKLKYSDIEKLKIIFPTYTIGDPVVMSYNDIEFIAFNPFTGVKITQLPELASVKREDRTRDTFLVKSYLEVKTMSSNEIEELGSFRLPELPDRVILRWELFGGAVNRVKSEDTTFVHLCTPSTTLNSKSFQMRGMS